jgi:hypothetical protein
VDSGAALKAAASRTHKKEGPVARAFRILRDFRTDQLVAKQ